MACLAPELWDFIGLMLSADWNVSKMECAMPANSAGMGKEGDQMMRGIKDEEDALWDQVDDITIDEVDVKNRGSYKHAHTSHTNAEHHEALITIVGFLHACYIYIFNSNNFLFS
jgi:hypothetical protein